MKTVLLLLSALFISTPASAGDIILKVIPIVEDKANPKVEYAYFDGDQKIASVIYDLMNNMKVLERTGSISDGKVKLYSPPDNALTEYTFKNGQKNGEAITHYANGKKSIVQNYKDDELEGLQQGFREDGSINRENIIHHNGQPSIQREFYENGKIKSETTYMIGNSFAENKTLSEKYFDEQGNVITNR